MILERQEGGPGCPGGGPGLLKCRYIAHLKTSKKPKQTLTYVAFMYKSYHNLSRCSFEDHSIGFYTPNQLFLINLG